MTEMTSGGNATGKGLSEMTAPMTARLRDSIKSSGRFPTNVSLGFTGERHLTVRCWAIRGKVGQTFVFQSPISGWDPEGRCPVPVFPWGLVTSLYKKASNTPPEQWGRNMAVAWGWMQRQDTSRILLTVKVIGTGVEHEARRRCFYALLADKRFRQLVRSNRPLAHYLVNKQSYQRAPDIKAIRKTLSLKQDEIFLTALGMLNPQAQLPVRAKALRRITGKDVGWCVSTLKNMRPDDLKVLSHLRTWNRWRIEAMFLTRGGLSVDMLMSISGRQTRKGNLPRKTRDDLNFARDVCRAFPGRVFTSWEEVRRVHEEMVLAATKARRQAQEESYTIRYGNPREDLPGWMTFLDCRESLEKEGQDMHHCVGTYHEACAHGKVAIYSILLEGERATLSLSLQEGSWEIDQLYGPCNQQVSKSVHLAVTRWLATV